MSKMLLVLSCALLLLAACAPTPVMVATATPPSPTPPWQGPDWTPIVVMPRVTATPNPAWTPAPTRRPYVAYDGKVYVTVLAQALDIGLWNEMGWRVVPVPLDTGFSGLPPLDCTLYPHKGVANQWVGGCYGYVMIPVEGGEAVGVVAVALDGTVSTQQIK